MKKHHCNPLTNCYNSRRSFRILTILILLCFVFSAVSNVYASGFLINQSNLDAVTSIINAYSNSDTVYSITDSKQLKSVSTNENEYTLYSLEPYGYAILLDESNRLMEACYQEGNTSPINLRDNSTYYYGGPMTYLLADGDNYIDISSNYILNEADVNAIQTAESYVIAFEGNISQLNADLRSSTISYNVNQGYFQNLVDFGHNSDGTCTILAISILLRYYDYFINDDYVDTRHQQGTGTAESFHQELIELAYNSGETDFGLYISGAVNVIDEYLGARGLNAYLDTDSAILNTNRIVDAVITLLSQNKPVVASMSTNHGGSFNHTVVVYGVTYNTSNKYDSAVYRMHTGWHDSASTTQPRLLTASASWFYQYGALECYYSSHQYTNYHEHSYTHHRAVCDCAAEITQAHTLVQTVAGNKCIKCGYCEGSAIMSIEEIEAGRERSAP